MLNIQQNIPLKDYTTFRIGGPARFFVEVKSKNELLEALKYAKENGLELFILGGGSNLLVSDKGYSGLIIKFKIQNSKFKVTVQSSKFVIECWAGDKLPDLVKYTSENCLTGLEWAVGLPATIGGAVRGNAGTFGKSMKDIVEKVRVYDLGNSQIKEFKNSECEFGYRRSLFKGNRNFIITSAVLQLTREDKAKVDKAIKEYAEQKKKIVPRGFSPGSFFKHPEANEHNLRKIKDVPRFKELKIYENNTIPAGFIIEECDLKGKKIGGAMVSEEHANFIVNTGNATAEDVIMLASIIKQQVGDKFGIELESEVQYLGF